MIPSDLMAAAKITGRLESAGWAWPGSVTSRLTEGPSLANNLKPATLAEGPTEILRAPKVTEK